MKNYLGFAAALVLSVLLFVIFFTGEVEGTIGSPQHCTWHGTAPVCWPSCPMGKISKMETKCGKNKLACCVTGHKKLCCPKDLEITPQMAAALAA